MSINRTGTGDLLLRDGVLVPEPKLKEMQEEIARLREALGKMVRLYESDYDPPESGNWPRPNWLRAALEKEEQ